MHANSVIILTLRSGHFSTSFLMKLPHKHLKMLPKISSLSNSEKVDFLPWILPFTNYRSNHIPKVSPKFTQQQRSASTSTPATKQKNIVSTSPADILSLVFELWYVMNVWINKSHLHWAWSHCGCALWTPGFLASGVLRYWKAAGLKIETLDHNHSPFIFRTITKQGT